MSTELNINQSMLRYARSMANHATGSGWANWMNECKRLKRERNRAAISLHWRLYLSGKTNVRPSVDMPLDKMMPGDARKLMAHYRSAR